MEQLEEKFKEVFNELPEPISINSTFLEIAGFPHYENVCSNILKYFFTPNLDIYDLNTILFSSVLEAAGIHDIKFSPTDNIKIKREVVTSSGRLDLLIFTSDYAIVIENKIYHHLHNNDLNEYAQFVENSYKRNKIKKIVLSLKKEEDNLRGGFTNVTYKNLIDIIEPKLETSRINRTDSYFIFKHFIQTIKNLYKNISMEKSELDFLVKHQNEIEQLKQLDNKLNRYISKRAYKIRDAISIGSNYEKWVYENYDVGFHYNHGDVSYKLECPITRDGMSIQLCVEQNRIDYGELKKLDLFRNNKTENFRPNDENSKLILEDNIDFFISDEELIEKLEVYLASLKISEVHEQLN